MASGKGPISQALIPSSSLLRNTALWKLFFFFFFYWCLCGMPAFCAVKTKISDMFNIYWRFVLIKC
jgi:hypothetical protein